MIISLNYDFVVCFLFQFYLHLGIYMFVSFYYGFLISLILFLAKEGNTHALKAIISNTKKKLYYFIEHKQNRICLFLFFFPFFYHKL